MEVASDMAKKTKSSKCIGLWSCNNKFSFRSLKRAISAFSLGIPTARTRLPWFILKTLLSQEMQ
ncbi:MAG: hypothetical protein EAX86_12020 [Candidatus Heimdallarchaeota archaeon]|nr:hypothetical protein [Candidatus Heimdallarchaeota archaeon]